MSYRQTIMNENYQKERKTEFWTNYWPSLQQATKETESYIDKKVYGIAAGGIGIEMASLQFINNVCFKWITLISGILFATTLVLNLYSHVRSLKSQEKEGDAIKQFFEDENAFDDSQIYSLIQKENRTLTRINKASIWTMLFAIVSLLAFIVLNI